MDEQGKAVTQVVEREDSRECRQNDLYAEQNAAHETVVFAQVRGHPEFEVGREQSPLGRIGQPQDIAPAAVFLASSDSAWITGETLSISGGYR